VLQQIYLSRKAGMNQINERRDPINERRDWLRERIERFKVLGLSFKFWEVLLKTIS